MKIVKVRHMRDSNALEYLFETPKNLKKGDLVICETAKSEEELSVCTADSIEIKKEQLEFLKSNVRFSLPLKKVVGKYNLEVWKK